MAAFKDYAAELKLLQQKQRELRAKHIMQLGELVIATGADALDVSIVAGALLAAVESSDKAHRDDLQSRGVRFLEARARPRRKAAAKSGGKAAAGSGAKQTDLYDGQS